MYEQSFGLSVRPFQALPQPQLYFAAETIEHALQTLIRGVDRSEGPGLIVGPAGTGKSMLCQLLAWHFRDSHRVVMLASNRLCTRRALLQNILFELQLPYRQMDEGELRLSLVDHLSPQGANDRGMLLIADEADSLPLRLLEEIRMITNLVVDSQPRVALVLAGGPRLEERLASPQLDSLNQRIASRNYLHSLHRDETARFIAHQLKVAGTECELFDAGALDAVFDATDGVPRLINQLCDHALLLASLGGRSQLDGDGVQEAWRDLQQLPVPYTQSASSSSSSGSSVVEFGALPDESPASVASEVSGSEAPHLAMFETDGDELSVAGVGQGEPVGGERKEAVAIESATENAPEDEFQPPMGTTEVELVFHGPHDPFGLDRFDDEEVVLDRYASLDNQMRQSAPRVTCYESFELARALGDETAEQVWKKYPVVASEQGEPGEDSDSQSEENAGIHKPADLAESGSRAEAESHSDSEDELLLPENYDATLPVDVPPESDPVYPHLQPFADGSQDADEAANDDLNWETRKVLLERRGIDLLDDDRDMIVVHPEEAVAGQEVAQEPPTTVERREYRNLFARLRQRT